MKPKALFLLGIALLAAWIAVRAVKRNTEVVTLLCVLIGLNATAGLANTPKTRSVENRLNSLIPVVYPNTGGPINGPVTVNGTHAVNGNASVSGSHTVGGQINAGTLATSGPATTYGLTVHGGIGADSSIGAGGNVTASGSLNGGQLYVSGQRIAPAQGTPGGYPMATNTPWGPGVVAVVNGIITSLRGSGILV